MYPIILFNSAFWQGFFDALLIGGILIGLLLIMIGLIPTWRRKVSRVIREQRSKW